MELFFILLPLTCCETVFFFNSKLFLEKKIVYEAYERRRDWLMEMKVVCLVCDWLIPDRPGQQLPEVGPE